MQARIGVVLVLLSFVGVVAAEQSNNKATKEAAPTSAAVVPVKPSAAAPASAYKAKPEPIDPDRAYKAHCGRCHLEPRKFSERKTATVMRHMRVRANLSEGETAAIFRYLTR